MVLLKVKVVPGSSRIRIDGWLSEFLKIRAMAKPKKGRANDAVIALLAERLGVPTQEVSISSGRSLARKVLKINILYEPEVLARLPVRDN